MAVCKSAFNINKTVMEKSDSNRGGGGGGGVEPTWAEGVPPGGNLGARWLSTISKIAPPSPLQDAAHGLLHALLCQGLAIDPLRSQPGHLFTTLLVTPGITNRYKTLHGGVIGSLVEILGCAAIRSLTRTLDGSVTDINISYISGTPVKDEVEFEAKVLRVGKSIAVAAVDVRNKESTKAVAHGRVTMCFDPTSKL